MLGRDHALSGAVLFAVLAPALHVPLADLPAGVVLGAGAGVLPDIDHPDSTIADSFGALTEGFAKITDVLAGGHRHGTHSVIGVAVFTAGAWGATWLQTHFSKSAAHIGPGHLSLWMIPAVLILTLLYASALRALKIGGHFADLIGFAGAAITCYLGTDVDPITLWHWKVPFMAMVVALGCIAHIAGDELTHSGCPVLWPVSKHEFHLLPKHMRITTAKMTETKIIGPGLTIVLVLALAFFVWNEVGTSVMHHVSIH